MLKQDNNKQASLCEVSKAVRSRGLVQALREGFTRYKFLILIKNNAALYIAVHDLI